jgi:hypothetical protein
MNQITDPPIEQEPANKEEPKVQVAPQEQQITKDNTLTYIIIGIVIFLIYNSSNKDKK